jgi:4-amino-4-deoxy-L-arabinose transferase-like glycosyltransferase
MESFFKCPSILMGKTVLLFLFISLSFFLLFARLGNYPLWDDETMVALAAEGILKTGDTSMVIGDNIVAYRGGILLKNLADRALPPLGSYLTAASFGVFGKSAWSARFPFALLGLIFIIATTIVIARSTLTTPDALISVTAILGNTSLFLFLRQCRYYAPSILLSSLIAICYIKWKQYSKRSGWFYAFLILLIPMFAANYMICAALIACMAIDFFFWKKKEITLSVKMLLEAILITVLPCIAIASVWNPYLTKFGSYAHSNGFFQRLTLFWWNIRDMNAAGFMIGCLLLVCLFYALLRGDVFLRRGLVALVVYISVISIVSPQLVGDTSYADIRYLCPTIPLCLALGIVAYVRFFGNRKILALLFLLPVFWTNLLNGTFLPPSGLRSVPLEYLGELASPPLDPYTPTATWIRDHVQKGKSVWVLPDYMTYPLMFHAPNAVYAWQLQPNQRKEKQFKDLPDIHFQGLTPPDYIICFGPIVLQIRQILEQLEGNGVHYREAGRINAFWKDLYRPELFWRSFKTIYGFDPETQGIIIFQRDMSSAH